MVYWERGIRIYKNAKESLMFLILWLFFILLSGKWTLEILLFGAGIAALVFCFACAFMDWSWKHELQFLRRLPRIAIYALTLLWEIVKANMTTLRRIFSRNGEEPAIVTFHTPLKTQWQRVLLANSITLTPGTITLLLDDDTLTVHCLNRADANGQENSDMEKRIARLEAQK